MLTPGAKYDQITIPGIGGGAESTSATVIGDVTIHDERADQDFPTHWLVAHEAAHQWWGDLVTMRDWTHAWIHEGFATYYENVYLAASRGDDEAAVDWLLKRDLYLREARTRYQRPIVNARWEFPDQIFDRHSYQKAALVIRLLRYVLGDAAYRCAITHFFQKHAFRFADTQDLLVANRESTGQVLDGFFDAWLYKPGHPVLSVESRWLEAEKVLEIRVAQTQESGGQPEVFPMPLRFGIATASGKRIERVWMQQRQQTYRFAVDARPMLVSSRPRMPSQWDRQRSHQSREQLERALNKLAVFRAVSRQPRTILMNYCICADSVDIAWNYNQDTQSDFAGQLPEFERLEKRAFTAAGG